MNDKAALIAKVLAQLEDDLATLERAHRATKAGATHEEAKPENDKDTRALEQQYLARGQAQRVLELREGVLSMAQVDPSPCEVVRLGAWSSVLDHTAELGRQFLLLPVGGGIKLLEPEGEIVVITPQSPWGRALLGARAGEEREANIAGVLRDFEVTQVR